MHEIGGYWVPESDKAGQGTQYGLTIFHLSAPCRVLPARQSARPATSYALS
jgi:hypothetical protein